MLRAFGVTDKGPVRSSNEDRFAIDEASGLCVLADGMGGHNAGEVAARIVVDEVAAHVGRAARPTIGGAPGSALYPFGIDPALSESANVLRNAILLAHMRILETAGTAPRYAGMGTTVVAAQAADGRLVVASAGDSRLYLLEGGTLHQLTADDSWMATVLATEAGDAQQFRHHPMRHALTNVVGGRSRTQVHVIERTLAGGELLLLTTDGVHGVVDADRLTELLTATDDLRATARAIVAEALERGAQDNVTAVVARYF